LIQHRYYSFTEVAVIGRELQIELSDGFHMNILSPVRHFQCLKHDDIHQLV